MSPGNKPGTSQQPPNPAARLQQYATKPMQMSTGNESANNNLPPDPQANATPIWQTFMPAQVPNAAAIQDKRYDDYVASGQPMPWTAGTPGADPGTAGPRDPNASRDTVNVGTNPASRFTPQTQGAPGAQPPAPPPGGVSPVQSYGAPGNSTPYGDVTRNVNTSNVPGMVGGDALAGQMHDAQDAAYKNATGYLDPQWKNQQDAMEAKLANQGVGQNSEAWNKAMDDFGRQKQFAYQQAQSNAVTQGNAAQGQLFNQGLLANNSQFNQNLQGGQFSNQVQQQLAAQGYTQQQIDNLEAQNRFQNSMGMRNQDINELLLQQQNPLNMLNALNSGGQVQQPNFTSTPGANVQGTDIASLINNAYNARTGTANSMTSGLFGLGGAAMMSPAGTFSGLTSLLSDRRLKTDIVKIGMHDSGVPLYTYRYVWGEPGVGVMADELEQVRPDAVHMVGGYKAVDYAAISRH